LLCGRPSFEASTFARTKAALAAAKTKGVTKDGRPLVLGRTGIEILAPKYRAEAKARAEQIAPVIRDLQQRGYSMRGIAVELDNCKVETPPGGLQPQTVSHVVERLASLQQISLRQCRRTIATR
jgi:hypothetical protein